MIRRIFIDNYKCFSNFEWYPDSMQLLLGKNGSGKTTVFDVLEILREFIVNGVPASTVFKKDSLTVWGLGTEQNFELDIEANGGLYKYQLAIKYDLNEVIVREESITFDGLNFYSFHGGEIFYPVDVKGRSPLPFPFEPSRSPISTIPNREEPRFLALFRERIRKIYVFSPDPLRMKASTSDEVAECDRAMHQLAPWLRHLVQESYSTIANIEESLKEVLENFEHIKIPQVSETVRSLMFNFGYIKKGIGFVDSNNDSDFGSKQLQGYQPISFSLDELSTGQKCLVALFTIVHAVINKDCTVCIDEPDNFIALREIQPWLTQLEDQVDDNNSQCFLISHHPELINYLAADHGELFYREEEGPVRVKSFEWKNDDPLLPAEIIAREWE